MSSSRSSATGKAAASVQLDEQDEMLLARFAAAGGESLFEYASKEELSGKKGKRDRDRRRANRDARNRTALATLEADDQEPEPDEQAVAQEAAVIHADLEADQQGGRWRHEFIRLMAHTAEHGAQATEEWIQRRADAAAAAQKDSASEQDSGDEDKAAGSSACEEAAMTMARQRAQRRLEQQQLLDAERRRKLLIGAAPTMITAADAFAAAEAEGLRLERSDNAAGFVGVRLGPAAAKIRPFQAVVYPHKSLGYFSTAEGAALAYARHTAPEKAARAAKAAAAQAAADAAATAAAAKAAADEKFRQVAEARAERRAEAEAGATGVRPLCPQYPDCCGEGGLTETDRFGHPWLHCSVCHAMWQPNWWQDYLSKQGAYSGLQPPPQYRKNCTCLAWSCTCCPSAVKAALAHAQHAAEANAAEAAKAKRDCEWRRKCLEAQRAMCHGIRMPVASSSVLPRDTEQVSEEVAENVPI